MANSGILSLDLRSNRTDMRALQKYRKSDIKLDISLEQKMPEKTLGQRLRKKRIEKGLNIKQLAKISGVSPDSLSYWERDLKRPRIKNLKKVADALGTNLKYLLQLKISKKDSIREKIYKFRVLNALTQKELAKMCNLDPTTIRLWESEKRKPSGKKLKQLLDVINDCTHFK